MRRMFNECNKLKEIRGINKFNTINVIDMSEMFQLCNKLEYLDLSNFNTSKVTNMSYMFYNCYKLKEIKGIYNFRIVSMANLTGIFDKCNNLECIDISKFNSFNSQLIFKIINIKFIKGN